MQVTNPSLIGVINADHNEPFGNTASFIIEIMTKNDTQRPTLLAVSADLSNETNAALQDELTALEAIKIVSIKASNGQMAIAKFTSQDGYTFEFDPNGQVWSDGDLTFNNAGLNPIDDIFNEPVEGSLVLVTQS